MSQPHGLKLKLKLPSSTPADPPPAADAAPSGSGVKLKLSLSGTGIKASSSGNARDEQHGGRQERDGRDGGDDVATDPPVEAGHPTTKIKLNFGKLANHAPTTDSTHSTAPSDAVKHEDQGNNHNVNDEATSMTDSPAKRGRGAATTRGTRGASVGARGRGRGRPKGSGKARGKSAIVSGANGADGAEVSETDGGPMDVDHAPVVEGRAEKGPDVASQPVIKQDLETVPRPTRDTQEQSKVDTASAVPIKPEPSIERPITPVVPQVPPPTAPTTSVTFAVPSPELSPAPSPQPQEYDTPSQLPTPTMAPLTLPRRSVSVMSASGNPTTGGSAPMTTASEMGTPTGGMDDPTEAMLADAAASGRVLFMGKGKPYLRAKKPLKDVLRKVLADIKRKDSVSLGGIGKGAQEADVASVRAVFGTGR